MRNCVTVHCGVIKEVAECIKREQTVLNVAQFVDLTIRDKITRIGGD